MDRLSIDSKNAIHNVAAHLPVIAYIERRPHKTRAEEIGVSRLLLKMKELVRPMAQIELMCGLSLKEEPIHAMAQVQYVEKTWAGYYVDAAISRLRDQDRARWEQFVHKIAASALAERKAPPSTWRWRPQIVTVGGSLPAAVRSELQHQQILIHHVASIARAMTLLPRRPDILIVDSSICRVDIRNLCEELGVRDGAPDLMFLVEYATEKEMDAYLAAGATRLVLKPANQHMLVHRIKAALVERAELQTAAYASARTLSSVAQSGEPSASDSGADFVGSEMSFWASLRQHLRGFVHHALHGASP